MSWTSIQRAIVPTDFSEQSIAAVDAAMEIVNDVSGIHVIHVLPELLVIEPSLGWTEISDENRIKAAEEQLAGTFSRDTYGGVQRKVLLGDPGQAIADYAREIGAELIILPSHGRTGLKRLLIGSVAERVVRLSHCPVLVLRE
jgi:nucleotide-binding universal stress UspA family protein